MKVTAFALIFVLIAPFAWSTLSILSGTDQKSCYQICKRTGKWKLSLDEEAAIKFDRDFQLNSPSCNSSFTFERAEQVLIPSRSMANAQEIAFQYLLHPYEVLLYILIPPPKYSSFF
ncbi:MAG: hypothetical protein LAT68_15520 [Cyclobacteriaceae bacterium]|nr:hypothetical protein [Cyclobacteriaceae bacterium]MCH8517731.1 hypothetical protein [Cyclobacteriaceae bacterium]